MLNEDETAGQTCLKKCLWNMVAFLGKNKITFIFEHLVEQIWVFLIDNGMKKTDSNCNQRLG